MYIEDETDLTWNKHGAVASSYWQLALFSEWEKVLDFTTCSGDEFQRIAMFLVSLL